ncbi:hypothetical protein B4U79_19178, partial [Dinothrombium tinctorium]
MSEEISEETSELSALEKGNLIVRESCCFLDMNENTRNILVVFGASGDLAQKKIYPTL